MVRTAVVTVAILFASSALAETTAQPAASGTAAVPKSLPRIETVMTTPLRTGTGYSPLLREKLEFAEGQQHSKWSIAFEESIGVEAVEVEVCDPAKPLEDGVELFVDFDQRRLFVDGGVATATFPVGGRARLLTLHFQESSAVCIQEIRIKSATGWERPNLLPVNLKKGDARVIDGWWSGADGATKPGFELNVASAEAKPLALKGLKVWNGNQGPGEVFTQSGRAREIEVKIDGVSVKKTTLEDRRFDQIVELPETPISKSIEVVVLSNYPGTDGDLGSAGALGEVRLISTSGVVVPLLSEGSKVALVDPFKQVGLDRILDKELRVEEKGDLWRLRIRSDGTFFARVFRESVRTARSWSAMGQWRVQGRKTVKSPAIKLRLTGVQISSAEAIDSIPCGTRCFANQLERGPASRSDGDKESLVSETVEIQADGRSHFFVRNRTNSEKRTLQFRDLKVRIHSLYD